jgi:hypothetical protein
MSAAVRSSKPFVRIACRRRRGFGLDTSLPADPALIEAEVLRLLAARAPDALVLRPSERPDRPVPSGHRAVPAFVGGAPDLLLLLPGGKSFCLKIRTQAERLSREQAAFGDLCRQRGIPYAVVRSLAEARAALRGAGVSIGEERS